MAIFHSSMSSLLLSSTCGTAPMSTWSAEQRGNFNRVSVLTHRRVYYYSVQSLQAYLLDRMTFKESGIFKFEQVWVPWEFLGLYYPLSASQYPLGCFEYCSWPVLKGVFLKAPFSIDKLSNEPCILLQCGCVTLSVECKVINCFPKITLQLSTSWFQCTLSLQGEWSHFVIVSRKGVKVRV